MKTKRAQNRYGLSKTPALLRISLVHVEAC